MLIRWQTRFLLLPLLALTCLAAAQDPDKDKDKDKDRSNKDKQQDSAPFDSAHEPTFRSAVSEVRVTFFATDESNHALQTLTTSDFAIVDNEKVVRNFRSLTRSDQASLDVVVLVDLSESVASNSRVAMSSVLQLVAREQSIADGNIAVLSFGGTPGQSSKPASETLRPAFLCSSGCRGSDSVAKLQAAKGGGLTPLFDALIFAADFISKHGPASRCGDLRGDLRSEVRSDVRPVFILFSDGNDTISLHSASEALQAVLEAGALIYSADVGTPDRPTSGRVFLQKISAATGGRYFSPRFTLNDGAAPLWNAVLEDLHASYVVTYDLPSHQAGFHALRLLPTQNLNLSFHSRTGYNYDASEQ
jgi:VWFA-related protein